MLSDPPAEVLSAFPGASFGASGVVVCGLPSAGGRSARDPDAVFPWGTQDFTLAHLDSLKTSLLQRFSTLSHLSELLGPNSCACHLALHVARINLQARFVHIWRYLPWPVLHLWAWSLQQHWTTWISALLSLPLDCPTASALLSLPVKQCGLGPLDVRHEAALHYLPGALALCDQAPSFAAHLDVPLHLSLAVRHLELATHLGLAVFAPEQRCSYVPVSSRRSCQAALGSHSHHVHHCAHGPRLRRHNQLCRTWTLLLRRAGWHVQTEQNIPLLGGDTKRADLVAVSSTGVTTVCDLQVTSTSDHSLPTAPLFRLLLRIRRASYSTTPSPRCPLLCPSHPQR